MGWNRQLDSNLYILYAKRTCCQLAFLCKWMPTWLWLKIIANENEPANTKYDPCCVSCGTFCSHVTPWGFAMQSHVPQRVLRRGPGQVSNWSCIASEGLEGRARWWFQSFLIIPLLIHWWRCLIWHLCFFFFLKWHYFMSNSGLGIA